MIPGEIIPGVGDIEINPGRDRLTLTVRNTGDRPVQVGSHFHFAEVNAALDVDRVAAWGYRLAVPAGTSVRFEPGLPPDVELVALAGNRVVPGLRGLAGGPLDRSGPPPANPPGQVADSAGPAAESPRPAAESARTGAGSAAPGVESSRPGAGSAAPGAESARPSAESSTPGAESARPGAESATPSAGSAAPAAGSGGQTDGSAGQAMESVSRADRGQSARSPGRGAVGRDQAGSDGPERFLPPNGSSR